MADYKYKDDGKIHTRYSELLRCTPSQISRLIAERRGDVERIETEAMAFGTTRHQMFQERAEKTKKLPKEFGLKYSADFIEHEFATELVPGVIVHSRPDVVSVKKKTIIDYKIIAIKEGNTADKAMAAYRSSKQLAFYAYQLSLHDIPIKNGLFLFELWNEQRTEILGYDHYFQYYNFMNLLEAYKWAESRILMLMGAVNA